ncbi:hypothetical protein Tco_0635002 [Tanacetum coccineum]
MDSDVAMVDTSASSSSSSKKGKRFEIKKWNAVSLWAWDIVVDKQRFDETFYEAWDRFNDLLRACPHHGFSELHQLDTFYNALNLMNQEFIDSAVGCSWTLPSNTITNLKVDLKGVTTRSGVAYQGPTIPITSSSLPKVVEHETEVTKDMVPPTNNGSTKDV